MYSGTTTAQHMKEAFLKNKNAIPNKEDILHIIDNIGIRIFDFLFIPYIHGVIIEHYINDPTFVIYTESETFNEDITTLLGHYLYKFEKYKKDELRDCKIYFINNKLRKDSSDEEEKFVNEFVYEFLMPKSKLTLLSTFLYSAKTIKKRFNVCSNFYEKRMKHLKTNNISYDILYENQFEECQKFVDILYKKEINSEVKEVGNNKQPMKRKIVLD